jgi:hypothetical protein
VRWGNRTIALLYDRFTTAPFAVRRTTGKPLTIQDDRLRRQKSEFRGSVYLLLLTTTELDSEPGPKPGVEPGVKQRSG